MYPNINNRKRVVTKDRLRKETLGVWRESVTFFNHVMDAVHTFPTDISFELDQKLCAAILRISDTIAQASNSDSKEIHENLLRTAENAIHETISYLYISEKWGYMNKNKYEQLFDEGRVLTNELYRLSGQPSMVQGQLN